MPKFAGNLIIRLFVFKSKKHFNKKALFVYIKPNIYRIFLSMYLCTKSTTAVRHMSCRKRAVYWNLFFKNIDVLLRVVSQEILKNQRFYRKKSE